MIGIGDEVTLHFRLTAADGLPLDSSFEDEPLVLVIGGGDLAAGLEQCLLGLEVGARESFELGPGVAFGQRDQDLVQKIPSGDLPDGLPLVQFNVVEFATPNGRHFTGVIVEVDDEGALVDFNHPFAGQALCFEVEVIGVRRGG